MAIDTRDFSELPSSRPVANCKVCGNEFMPFRREVTCSKKCSLLNKQHNKNKANAQRIHASVRVIPGVDLRRSARKFVLVAKEMLDADTFNKILDAAMKK